MAKLLSKCVFTQCLTESQYKFFSPPPKTPPLSHSTYRFWGELCLRLFVHLTYSPHTKENTVKDKEKLVQDADGRWSEGRVFTGS